MKIGAAIDQQLGGLHVPAVDCVVQRGPTAFGRRIDVRVRVEQAADDVDVAIGGRPHQRRPAGSISRVDRRMMIDERLHRFAVTPRGRVLQRCAMVSALFNIDVGALFQEFTYPCFMPAGGRAVQLRKAVAIEAIDRWFAW